MRFSKFDDSIRLFLRKKGDEECIFISTYGLDETVLCALLRRYEVPSTTRIVVCHEIMRHRFPGYLGKHYRKSTVISVVHAGKKRCPVFHPKLWMKTKGRECRELLIGSFNLTRYHLDEEQETMESICHWDRLRLALPRYALFDLCRSRNLPASQRIKLAPVTISVTCGANGPTDLDVKRAPVAYVLEHRLGLDEDRLEFGCAPFCSDRAVASIAGTEQEAEVRVWDARMVHAGWDLHAKCLEFDRHVILGSANLTEQALLGKDREPLNTEAIICLPKRGQFLKPYFRGIRPRQLETGKVNDSNPPGDPEEGEDNDWAKQKELAINAPEELRLSFEERGQRERLRIIIKNRNGRRSGRLTLRSEGRNDIEPLRLTGAEARDIPRRNWRLLAKMILNPPIQVEGKSGRKQWRRELDIDDFWLDVEDFRKRLNRMRNSISGNDLPQEDLEDRLRNEFVDVRDIRDSLMR
ncbi:MAG: hypothetical protein HYY46_09720, partial [Deltaproteobacteria bacterium]|nr:hypothetical protein [Deltaproteobacteria bacterium]